MGAVSHHESDVIQFVSLFVAAWQRGHFVDDLGPTKKIDVIQICCLCPLVRFAYQNKLTIEFLVLKTVSGTTNRLIDVKTK